MLDLERLRRLDLDVLVFPQGTRSKRTSRGHPGLMQMAQHLGASIVRADFVPFSHGASMRHGEAFQAATAVGMERIDGLLDAECRSLEGGGSDGVRGVRRFA